MHFAAAMTGMRDKSWNPYVVGAGIGALNILSLATAKQTLGVSSVFEEAVAAGTLALVPDDPSARAFQEARGEPEAGWSWGLVAGALLGSYLSAHQSGDTTHAAPTAGRYLSATAGGAMMMLGARIARGCTSGHGISGTMKLAPASWMFDAVLFGAGTLVAKMFFERSSR